MGVRRTVGVPIQDSSGVETLFASHCWLHNRIWLLVIWAGALKHLKKIDV